MKKTFITSLLLLTLFSSMGQVVYQHVSNNGIYGLLDELANARIILVNSAIKPYSRMYIAEKLIEAIEKKDQLNKRQIDEIEFYLMDYQIELEESLVYNEKYDLFKSNPSLFTSINPLGVHFKDNLFTASARPIWGINYFFNENGNLYHRWGGVEVNSSVGKNWGFYASLRDNSESGRLGETQYLTQRFGSPYKEDTTGGDYSEMRAGITYSWKWGSIGLVKDHFVWGNNYNGSNILSGRTPSFASIKLHLNPVEWFEFNYIHGWLVSEVVDSTRTYTYKGGNREIFHEKYIAANMFTIKPWKNLNISFGNSIVYSDLGVHPAYLIPFAFYKSIDHTLNSTANNTGQNAQMFFDVSSRQIKNLHLYASAYFDEISISNMWDKEQSSNWFSIKSGIRLSNLIVNNLLLTAEYTRTNPITYKHFNSTTTFESNSYNMGHYLRDNAQDIYFCVGYKPIRGLDISIAYNIAQVGQDYERRSNSADEVRGLPFIEELVWENETVSAKARYEFINNGYLHLEFMTANIRGNVNKYTPEFFHGETNTISLGFNVGF